MTATTTEAFTLDNQRDGRDYHHFTSLILVMVYTFLGVCAFAIVIPTSKHYAAELAAPAWLSGLSIGATVFASAVASPIWKKIADQYSLGFSFKVSAVIQLIGSVLYALAGFADSIPMLLLGRIIQGLGNSQNIRISYLSRAVSTRKLTGTLATEAAMQAFAYAGGPLIAFFISLFHNLDNQQGTAYSQLRNDGAVPGWFMALAWLMFLLLTMCMFQEPDAEAGFTKTKSSKFSTCEELQRTDDPATSSAAEKSGDVPSFLSLQWSAVMALLYSIFVMPLVFGAFEVLTVELSQQEPMNLSVQNSSLFLAGVMFVCASLTVASKPLLRPRQQEQKPVLSDRAAVMGFFSVAAVLIGLVFCAILKHVYSQYTTPSSRWPVFVIYALTVSLACTALNIARAGSVALLSKPVLCPPQHRDWMLVIQSFVYLFGRGLGPVLGSAVEPWICVLILTILCGAIVLVVGSVFHKLDSHMLPV